jgi:transmembrane sensor
MNDDLLVKHLTGEATAEEYAEVEAWLHASTDNQRYYDGFIQIWEQSLQLAANGAVNEDEAWQRFKQRIDNNTTQQPVTVKKINGYRSALRIAASIILVAGMGWLGYYVTGLFTGTPVKQLAVQTKNNVLIDTLTDGSVITVNKHSAVNYPSAFKGNTREITLTGEAFFNIAPDKNKPFIIHVNGIKVTVVGTSFNIRTVNGKTEVIVETGIVKVTNNKQTIQLTPKEKIVTDSVGMSTKDTTADKLYNYYRSREFVCDNTPLKRLVEILNEAYDTNIIIENKAIETLPITTTFKEEPLQHILTVISETLGVTVEKRQEQYILH